MVWKERGGSVRVLEVNARVHSLSLYKFGICKNSANPLSRFMNMCMQSDQQHATIR